MLSFERKIKIAQPEKVFKTRLNIYGLRINSQGSFLKRKENFFLNSWRASGFFSLFFIGNFSSCSEP
jgi:hypothetical protein